MCEALTSFTIIQDVCVCVSDVSHMIHIIDTEHPWDVYSINSGHTEVISCLEWDQSGELIINSPVNKLWVYMLIFLVCFCLICSSCVGHRMWHRPSEDVSVNDVCGRLLWETLHLCQHVVCLFMDHWLYLVCVCRLEAAVCRRGRSD